MDTYPIVIHDKRAGTLQVRAEGLMTEFSGSAADGGELVRLSVYGGGREGYLGVMCPDRAGWLTIRRRLSRAAMAGFPGEIEYAAPAGLRREEPPPERYAPEPESAGDEDMLWFSTPDGTLTAFDGKRCLVALPASQARLPRGAQALRRLIGGREYVVFPR